MDENTNGGPGLGFPRGAVFLAAPDAVIVIDGSGAIRDWNPAARALFRFTREEALGRELAELIIPTPLRDAHRSALRRYLQTGKGRMHGHRLELTALRRDGAEMAVELSVTRLAGADPPLFAGFVRSLRERTRTERDSARMQHHMHFLAQAGLVLDQSLDYNETLRNLAQLTVPDLAHLTVIDVLGPRGATIEMAVAACREPALARRLERLRGTSGLPISGSHPVGSVLRTGAPLLLSAMSAEFLNGVAQNEEHLALIRDMGYRSAVVVPLVARSRTLGTLSLLRMEDGTRYNEDDLVLAEELARRAGLAVDNARLFESTRDLARTLQQSLLPHELPKTPGFTIAARYRAADRAHEVGGDFYDAFRIGADRWGITIGDVCGKGAEAAALTALARYTIRAYADRNPGRVLRRLNQTLVRERDVVAGRYLTALMAVASPRDGKLVLDIAAGGHPAPLVMRAGGVVQRVPVTGPLIGMAAETKFATTSLELSPGDAVLLYTDGLTDAHAPDRILTESDVMALLARGRGLSGPELAAFIEAQATQGPPARDDIALLVIQIPQRATDYR
jgi:PAS domain S-box-containing protein